MNQLKIFSRTGTRLPDALNAESDFFTFGGLVEEKIVHFWDMPASSRFELRDGFRERLFVSAAKGDFRKIARDLQLSYSYLQALQRGLYSVPLETILKLGDYSDISLSEIEENISFTRTRHGKKTAITTFVSPR